MSEMKYRPVSCCAPIRAALHSVRRGNGRPPTVSLTQHTQTHKHTRCQYGHSGADSCGGQSLTVTSPFILEFFFSSQHAWTRTHSHTHTLAESQRPWEEEQRRGIKKPSPCRGSLRGLAWHYGKIRLQSALLCDVTVWMARGTRT